MKMVGVYIGENKISAAVVERKRLISAKSISLSPSEEEIDDIKNKIMEVFSKLDVDVERIYIGLSGRNLIFRLIDFPYLGKRELEAALPLEAEKYMPFKIKEVNWGCRYRKDFKNRKVHTAFLAERKNIIDSYISLFNSLGLKIEAIESGFLSLFSFLVKRKYVSSKIQQVAFINISTVDMEVAIFEKNFPYFNRYSKFPLDELGNVDQARIIDEIRITFDYYKREFHKENNPALIVAVSPDMIAVAEEINSAFSEEEIKIITPQDIMPEAEFEDFEAIKAYSLVSQDVPFKERILINLLKEKKEEEIETDVLPKLPSLNIMTIIVEVILGMAIIGFSFFNYTKKEGKVIAELNKARKDFHEHYKEFGSFSYEQMEKKDEELLVKIGALDKLISVQIPIYKYLDAISSSVTSGLWLKRLNFSSNHGKNILLSLEGYVFLDDSLEERKSVESFIVNLRNNDFIKRTHSYVNLRLVAKTKLKKFDVTRFEIEIKGIR